MNHWFNGTAQSAMRDVAGWVPPLARLGYAAKGIVYVLVGAIAVRAALALGSAEGSTGALASLVDAQGGPIVLRLIAVGLLCHVLWRLVQAVLDPEHSSTDGKRVAIRIFYALSAAIYISLAYTAWQLAKGESAGSGDGTETWVAKLLEQPFGAWAVMAAGLGVAAYGIHQLYKAWRGDVSKRMSGSSSIHVSRGMRFVGRAGTAARGVVLLPIGWLLFNAGRLYSAPQAADTGEVLEMLGRGWLLAVVGAGLLAYGLHQIAKAIYRRIERPN
jgi:type IV secretory pathway VirB2 component (pilin)